MSLKALGESPAQARLRLEARCSGHDPCRPRIGRLFDRLTIIHPKSICRSLLDAVWKGCPCAKNRPTPDRKDAWLNLDNEESANCLLKRYRVVFSIEG
jgi:hypothetical protein